MFQSDMAEAASKRVDIQDLQSDVVNDMLVYIYTGVLKCVIQLYCTSVLYR